jgi:hypothetical protein
MKKKFLITSSIISITLFTTILGNIVLAKDNSTEGAAKLFSISKGNTADSIGYSPNVVDLEKRGPESFAVSSNGSFYILDTINNQVKIFDKNGIFEASFKLPDGKAFNDIEISGKTVYVMNEIGELYKYENGKQIDFKQFDVKYQYNDLLGLFHNKNNKIVVRYLDGRDIEVDSLDVVKGYDGSNSKKVEKGIELSEASNGKKLQIEYNFTPAGTFPIEVTSQNESIILENEALIGKGLYVETRLEKFKDGISTESALALSTKGTYYGKVPHKYIYTTKNGESYQMVAGPDNVSIYQLEYSKVKKTRINSDLINEIQPDNSPIGDASIADNTRSVALSVADAMINYSWSYTPATKKTAVTTTTQPPNQLNTTVNSTQTGIPYGWGRTNGQSAYGGYVSFATGLAVSGNTAGNVNTTTTSGVASTIGLDCSGYISVAYNLATRAYTNSMTTAFLTWTWSSLQAGDIANSPSSGGVGHVWMYTAPMFDSSMNLLGYYSNEATVSGNPQKTKYYTHTLSDAANFTPMTHK